MYEYLEHTADLKVKVSAGSFEELVAEVVNATMDAIYELDKVEAKSEGKLEISDLMDPGELLFEVANYFLGLLDSEGKAVARIRPEDVKVRYDGSWSVEISYRREEYSKDKHGFETLVKAFTYNELKICFEGYERKAEFVLDI